MPNPDIPMLDDDAIAEIAALSAKVPDGPWFTATDDAVDVPDHRRSGLALVETGRSADWWIARLCEWHIANFIAASKTNVDALCATVRALRASDQHNYELWLHSKERYAHRFKDGTWPDGTADRFCEQCGISTSDDHAATDCIAHLRFRLQRAVTSMRSACVDAIRSLRHKSEPDDSRWNAALYHAETRIESLTLQEQEAKQS